MEMAKDASLAVMLVSEFEALIHTPAMVLSRAYVLFSFFSVLEVSFILLLMIISSRKCHFSGLEKFFYIPYDFILW